MTTSNQRSLDDRLIDRSILRMNTVATAVGIGMLCGVVLFAATIWLALRNGPFAGPHLGLLSQYLPGYSVTVVGAFVGAFYAFLIGGAAGYLLSSIYNRLSR